MCTGQGLLSAMPGEGKPCSVSRAAARASAPCSWLEIEASTPEHGRDVAPLPFCPAPSALMSARSWAVMYRKEVACPGERSTAVIPSILQGSLAQLSKRLGERLYRDCPGAASFSVSW